MRAALLDLYGTLIELRPDTRPLVRLARLSRTHTVREALDAMLVRPHRDVAELARGLGVTDDAAIESCAADVARDVASAAWFDDARRALATLRDRGVRTVVVSNLASPYCAPVRALGLDALVSDVVFSCDVGLRKPDPAIFRLALERAGVDASDAVMVGDSLANDVHAARRAGLRAVALYRGDGAIPEGAVRSLEAFVAS